VLRAEIDVKLLPVLYVSQSHMKNIPQKSMHQFLKLTPLTLAMALGYALPLDVIAQTTNQALPEVQVKGAGDKEKRIQPKLRDEIVTTESISEKTIQKTNASTLNEAIDFNPGVSVQTECSICNVRNVTLNNLPGRFTTIMIDGIPIFSSVSSAYGLDMIGVNGVERIDISRGAGASLIAPEALSGTVNIISKRPKKEETVFETQFGQNGYRKVDGYWAKPFEGGAITLNVHGNHHDTVDSNGNGVGEYTGYKRALVGAGLFLDDVGGFKIRGRVDGVDEKRGGGPLGSDYDAIKHSLSGNPFDWSQGKGGSPSSSGWVNPSTGSIIPYDSGRGGFSEIIFTKRQQAILSGERDMGGGDKLKLAFGYAHHAQDSFYEGDYYKAQQNQYYTEASWQKKLGANIVTAGLNYRYEDLKSHGTLIDGTAVNGLDNYTYRTPGVFLQAYRALFDDRLELNGSVRHDRHNVFGNINTPRLNALWHHTHDISSRFAVGTGYRAPTSFFEQDHGILSTTRIEREITQPEKSKNASYAFSYADEKQAFVASANYNKITNYALLDSSATDPVTGAPITVFTQSGHPLIVKGIDATYTRKLGKAFEATVAGEVFNYQFHPGDLSFARPKHRAYLRLDYNEGPWQLFARATWTGSMDLARFYDYANTPRYNMDGTPKLDKSPSYWVVDLNGRYRVNKNTSLIFGVNNLFDFVQTKYEDFLWVDKNGHYDVTHFWGPGRGRQVYAGLRLEM